MERLIKPLHDYIVVRQVKETVTGSGIVMPNEQDKNEFEVINSEERRELLGEIVVLNKHANLIEIDGAYLVSYSDVIAIIS